MDSSTERERRGAYGLSISGIPTRRLGLAEPTWEEWRVEYSAQGPDPTFTPAIGSAEAHIELGDATQISMWHSPRGGSAVIRTPARIPPEELAHPYLSPIGIVAGRWTGRLPLHAGAFVLADRAWLVAASPDAGKSSTLAALHALGIEVMSDDLAIVDVGDPSTVFGGPRLIDLREGPASALHLGMPVGRLGLRDRWRVELPSCRPTAPLEGVIVPTWGPSAVRRLSLSQALVSIAPHVAVRARDDYPGQLLELCGAMPVVAWSRERRLEGIRPSVEALLKALE